MKSTKDIYLAATFIALGARYSHANKEDPRHMEFFFETPHEDALENSDNFLADLTTALPDLNKIEKDWVNGNVMVNAVKYKEAIQRMKSIVHSL